MSIELSLGVKVSLPATVTVTASSEGWKVTWVTLDKTFSAEDLMQIVNEEHKTEVQEALDKLLVAMKQPLNQECQ